MHLDLFAGAASDLLAKDRQPVLSLSVFPWVACSSFFSIVCVVLSEVFLVLADASAVVVLAVGPCVSFVVPAFSASFFARWFFLFLCFPLLLLGSGFFF